MSVLVDPDTKEALVATSECYYRFSQDNTKITYRSDEGCGDFVRGQGVTHTQRQVYDEVYSGTGNVRLTAAAVREEWEDPTVPWRQTMLESLGSLSGKTVLLLGNGSSYKEFYFLLFGARLVFTDLSWSAVVRARNAFRQSDLFENYAGQVEFHAVDAMRLPFANESFDLIYGAKCVGFLDDRSRFFSEVRRCLKTGGVCRFADDALSPSFERVKRTILRPLRRLKSVPRSPHDVVRSKALNGFAEEEIRLLQEEHAFSNVVWIRQSFFLRVAQLMYGYHTRWDPVRLEKRRTMFLLMKWVDARLERTEWLRRNALALTWGLDK